MEQKLLIVGEWYVFEDEGKVMNGYIVSKHINFATIAVRTSSGFHNKKIVYGKFIKKSPINSLAKADYIDFLLDIKDYEELKLYCQDA